MATLTMSQKIENSIQENQALVSSMKERPVLKVTRNQFIDLIRQNHQKGTRIATIYAVTYYGHDAGMQKATKKHRVTGLPTTEMVHFPIQKIYAMQFHLGANYENCVKNQYEREGLNKDDFEKGSSWMQPIELCDGNIDKIFGKHSTTDEIYMRVPLAKRLNSMWFDGNNTELENDQILDLQANVLPKKSTSQKQECEKKVIFITVKINNIKYAVVNGIIYELI